MQDRKKLLLQGLEDISVYMMLLLENMLAHEAFAFLRAKIKDDGLDAEKINSLQEVFFSFFIRGISQLSDLMSHVEKKLGFLFQLPLNEQESKHLVQYLRDNNQI